MWAAAARTIQVASQISERQSEHMATDEFRPILEGLRDASLAMVEANQALIRGGQGLQRAAEAAVRARDELADLRDHVTTLEGMIAELLKRK
jgi:hypothetical protein